MSIAVITPPKPIVSLQQAKQHLRVEDSGEDAYISGLIEAAIGHIDGPHGWLGLALGEQVIEATLCSREWSCRRRVPIGPLQEILTETPSADTRSVVVRYRAGHPFSGEGSHLASSVPAPIRQAILLMVGDLYANRESNSVGVAAHVVEMPTTVERLLLPYRVNFGC